MLTVKQLFIADGVELEEDNIKLVRHVDHLNRSIQRITSEEHFEFYQQEQSPKVRPFHNCEVILSFIGIEGNKLLKGRDPANFQWSIGLNGN
jgi:hypothetical protein